MSLSPRVGSERFEPIVFIIVLNWKGAAKTIECLEVLRTLDYPRWRVVVLDNGSDDDSVDEIRAWVESHTASPMDGEHGLVEYEREVAEAGGTTIGERRLGTVGAGTGIVLIRNGENLGFAAGCNVGITYALLRGADFVFLLNNDASVTRSTLIELVSAAGRADAAIVGARTLDEAGRRVVFSGNRWPKQMFLSGGSPGNHPPLDFWPSSDAQGGSMLLRRDLLEGRARECGYYFDPGFFMYREDTDLCRYADARGYRCVLARDAVVYHGFASSSGGVGHPRVWYYMTRNRVRLAHRWLGWPLRLCFHLYYAPSRLLLQFLRPRNWRSGRSRAVIAGLIDGYRGVKGKWVRHG
jgi:GT2 family glycosyltransferase